MEVGGGFVEDVLGNKGGSIGGDKKECLRLRQAVANLTSFLQVLG